MRNKCDCTSSLLCYELQEGEDRSGLFDGILGLFLPSHVTTFVPIPLLPSSSSGMPCPALNRVEPSSLL